MAVTFTEPLYVVLFEGNYADTYLPIVPITKTLEKYRKGEVTLPLGFDKKLTPILDILWYCLHLPKTRFDLIDISTSALKQLQQLHLPHHIAVLPVPCPPEILDHLNNGWPKVIFLPDDLLKSAEQIIATLTDVVDVVRASEIDEDKLAYHWDLLYSALAMDRSQYVRARRLISNRSIRAALIPMHFLVRQMRGGSDDAVPAEFSTQQEIIGYSLHCQAVLSTVSKLEAKATPPDQAERIFPAALREESSQFECPVSVGVPGVSPKSASRTLLKAFLRAGLVSNAPDEEIEGTVLGFVAAHRALSKGGIGFVSPKIDDEAFALLDKLENMWAHRKPRPRPMWRLLDSIGAVVRRCFADEEVEAMLHASILTSFSEFPIGLATLPGGSSPLCCRVPIAYRPLLPLTRTLQFELAWMPTKHLKGRLRILVAECIALDDPVGRLSREGWNVGVEALTENPNIECDVIEARSVVDLRSALRENKYDILVISAHGGVDRGQNRTGFVCGNKLVVGQELGPLPVIVCLSACQVSPRGSGTVNISDLMFREGAAVVIGTMVPVDVRRNATLMVRFFVNLSEALQGRSPGKRLEEIWHFTCTSNAVNDILSSNTALWRWATESKGQKSVIEEFMLERSAGRLRKNHVYQDTESILAEIAADRGILNKFRSWISSQGYIPESIFYALLGWPERIVLYDAEFEKIEKIFPSR